MTPKNSVVFDNFHFLAFIKIAQEEKLILIDHKKTDGRFELFLPKKVSKNTRIKIYEQLTISPKVITNDFNFKTDGISGELIDNGVIQFVNNKNLRNIHNQEEQHPWLKLQFNEIIAELERVFPYSIISSITNSKSEKKYNVNEVKKIMNYYVLAIKHQLSMGTNAGRNMDFFFKRSFDFFKEDIDKRLNKDFRDETNKMIMKEVVQDKYIPILKSIEDFLDTIELARTHNSYVSFNTPRRLYKGNKILKYSTEMTAVYKVISDGLNKKSYRSSLKETLKLSKDTATESLRIYMNELINNIENLSEAEIHNIRKEINKAIHILDKNSKLDDYARICTYIGLPISTLGVLGFINPTIGAVTTLGGLSISFLGVLTTKINSEILKSYRWATFQSN